MYSTSTSIKSGESHFSVHEAIKRSNQMSVLVPGTCTHRLRVLYVCLVDLYGSTCTREINEKIRSGMRLLSHAKVVSRGGVLAPGTDVDG